MKPISPRQTEIFILRQAGLTERQIADALGLRYWTVHTYCAHLHAAGLLPGRRAMPLDGVPGEPDELVQEQHAVKQQLAGNVGY